MKTFFVTGLPRSRTAWMATYLTWGKTFCFHDGFTGLDHPAKIHEKFDSMREKGFENVGNSDPANLYFIDTLIEQFPDAKWFLIERFLPDAVKSSREAFKINTKLEYEFNQLNKLRKYREAGKIDMSWIDFNCIDSSVNCGLFDCVSPNIPMERTMLFETMQIQLTEERLSNKKLFIPELLEHSDKHECILA
jgi:hypothetical protein